VLAGTLPGFPDGMATKARDHSPHDALRIHSLQDKGMPRPISQQREKR
jgi:hypothetical protein